MFDENEAENLAVFFDIVYEAFVIAIVALVAFNLYTRSEETLLISLSSYSTTL